jgi:hypothetical protein
MLCSRLWAITGSITLSWKLPDWPAMADRGVVADDLRRRHRDGLRNDRIDLARHDAAARLQRRQRDLAEPRQRTAVHPAQVVRDLHQRHGQRAQVAGQLDRRVLRGEAAKKSRRGAGRVPVCAATAARHLRGKLRVALMPVPTAVPPCASACSRGRQPCSARCRPRPATRHAPSSWPSVSGIASIRCVRPVLTTSPTSAALRARVSMSSFSAGSSAPTCERGADVDHGRNHVVAALARD